jgi:hypothetical protein
MEAKKVKTVSCTIGDLQHHKEAVQRVWHLGNTLTVEIMFV